MREALAKLLVRSEKKSTIPTMVDVSFAYRLYWTRQVREWPEHHRLRVEEQVQQVLSTPDFEANAYERTYAISEADDQFHAGASIEALAKVLRAFREYEL